MGLLGNGCVKNQVKNNNNTKIKSADWNCQRAEEVVARDEHEFLNKGQIMKGKISFVKYLGLYSEKKKSGIIEVFKIIMQYG